MARSADWPDWLRLLLARRLAYGEARGYAIPRAGLEELAGHADPIIGLWAASALALAPGSEPRLAAPLEQAARIPGEQGELASMLLAVLAAPPGAARLDEATIWLRCHPRPGGDDLARLEDPRWADHTRWSAATTVSRHDGVSRSYHVAILPRPTTILVLIILFESYS